MCDLVGEWEHGFDSFVYFVEIGFVSRPTKEGGKSVRMMLECSEDIFDVKAYLQS